MTSSAVPVKRRAPSGAHARPRTVLPCDRRASGVHVAVSHSRTVVSRPPEANTPPSGLQPITRIDCVWPPARPAAAGPAGVRCRRRPATRRPADRPRGCARNASARDRCSARLATPAGEEAEEFDAFAESPPQDDAVAHHLGADGEDLAWTEVEPTVELLERGEDLGAGEVRIAEHARQHAGGVDQVVVLQP